MLLAWSTPRFVRDVHFVSSLLLAFLLVFFATTGFMAQHREWFHPRVDRDQLSEPVGLTAPCDGAGLAEIGGVPLPDVEDRGTWRLVDVGRGSERLACRVGESTASLGRIDAWPVGVDVSVDAFRLAWEAEQQHRLEAWAPPGLTGRTSWWRHVDVWSIQTFEVDPARQRVVVWTQRLPLAMSLIELHRGRGATDLLVDIAAGLVLLVSLSGVVVGLRFPGARRRLLVAMLIGSLVLVGVLLAG